MTDVTGATRGRRLGDHPVMPVAPIESPLSFMWKGRPLIARPGEVISSALIAAGVDVFGRHPRDGSPLGLFCANGQCASCTVVVDGVPVKACMTPVRPGMEVKPVDHLPGLPVDGGVPDLTPTRVLPVEALVIGAGPAGMSAAAELGENGIGTLVVDDKARPGGKLVLQTHKFFGSREQTSAGARGIDIAEDMARRLEESDSVTVWTETTAVGVYADRRVGVIRRDGYWLVEPRVLLVATGARERQLPFPGHTLPGVFGAGAFQTLLNRDGVVPCERLLIVGGGNVGLIAAYHALQADITVVGLVEVMPDVGGYRVHADKLRRLGIPVHLSHTIAAAHGTDRVEAATIAAVDGAGRVVDGSERTFEVDGVLVAAGLTPLDELAVEAAGAGIPAFTAGDAGEVAEASAAAIGGRLAARQMLRALGHDAGPAPEDWERLHEVLKSRPGPVHVSTGASAEAADLFPVLRCGQEIPCNPCISVCRRHALEMVGDPLTGIPRYVGEGCTGCNRCVAICPGLAITLVDRREDPDRPLVTVPFEMPDRHVDPGSLVLTTDEDGMPLGRFEVVDVKNRPFQNRTRLVRIRATADTATRIAGIRVLDPEDLAPIPPVPIGPTSDDVIVCRCEHVTAAEIRSAIRSGVRDVNELKAMLRVCMGACCGKNCPEHIAKLYRDEGIREVDVAPATHRPPVIEVPLGLFAGGSQTS